MVHHCCDFGVIRSVSSWRTLNKYLIKTDKHAKNKFKCKRQNRSNH